jgi:transcriptional regulator with XRE-family HTH domain
VARLEHPESAPRGPLEEALAQRVREFRLARGLTLADVAQRAGVSKGMLSKIENAQISCSLSTISSLAEVLEVPVTALFRGVDGEREAVFTPSGNGAQIIRRGSQVGHLYQMLGSLRGENKRIEPLLVTLTDASEVFPLFQHAGTEFIYMLEGVLIYSHGEARYELRRGDSLVFDGEGPHGPAELSTLPIRFLSVIAYGHVL